MGMLVSYTSVEFIKLCPEIRKLLKRNHNILAISTPGHNPPPSQAPKIQTPLTYKDSQND